MHELSLCRNMLQQIAALAEAHHAVRVHRISLHIGPLAGVEAPLLRQAFAVAAAGGIAEQAELDIEVLPIRIACPQCGTQGDATLGNLACTACGNWQTRLLSGDEMLLAGLEMDVR